MGKLASWQVFNAVIGRMVSAVLWVSPVGVASLIAAAICNACDLLGTAAALGLWIGTVMGGLAIFAGLLLPALLWALTRCNPFQTLRGFSPALLLGFGTGSSAASLPVSSLASSTQLFIEQLGGGVRGGGGGGVCKASPDSWLFCGWPRLISCLASWIS